MSGDKLFQSFASALIAWSESITRDLPWKCTRDPYRIWLSEIILQQTRVAQGIPYYHKFVKTYPTVHDLADASESRVLNDWQGLGYNARARNLHAAAKVVSNQYQGIFPDSYEGLLSLPGVGPYTAAAIASFAFDRPVPVIDTNVLRVVSRILGLTDHVGTSRLRNRVDEVLRQMIISVSPAIFNQAIMDFGATVCLPKRPHCDICPLSGNCVAFNSNLVEKLPVRKQRASRRSRYFHYLVIISPRSIVLQYRTNKDIWQRMYDFPLIERQDNTPPPRQQIAELYKYVTGGAPKNTPVISSDTQVLTHQKIHATFYSYVCDQLPDMVRMDDYSLVDLEKLNTFAVPKIVDCYFRANSILL